MPVSPIQKQDLTLIKGAFERGALAQDTRGATWLPMVTSVQQSRRIHETAQAEAKEYPSATSQPKAKNDKSFLQQAQAECIPCASRISVPDDLDIGQDLFATMMAYNERALQNMLGLFSAISQPNRIQENMCQAYHALRSQCIPDIARLISHLTLLVQDLRSFNLKSLKDQLVQLIGSLIVRSLVFGALNYDKYITLITDVARCIVTDINTQLKKLEPILSGERNVKTYNPELADDATTTEIVNAITSTPSQDSWTEETRAYNYAKDASIGIAKVEYGLNKAVSVVDGHVGRGVDKAANVGYIISDVIEDSIALADNKLQNATSELLKFLKLSDGNMKTQIQTMGQIQLIQSILEVLRTIRDTRGDFNPCGSNDGTEAGRRFFSRIRTPGQDIIIDNLDPENPELTIMPPTFKIDNPIVEAILNEHGIETGSVEVGNTSNAKQGNIVKSGRVVKSVPISINISKCLAGKQ